MNAAMQSNLATLAARAGASVLRRAISIVDPSADRSVDGETPASGWLAVTVLREAAEIDTTTLPAPLAEFGDRIEVRVRPAPADKGTELAARLRDAETAPETAPKAAPKAARLAGEDPQADLRSALRRAKQLIEVGEVLAVDPAPHGERTPTPGGVLLEAWTQRAPKAGVR